MLFYIVCKSYLSVVGSGPTLMPGKSVLRRYFIIDDFPVEYWPEVQNTFVDTNFSNLPMTSTCGRPSKSVSFSGGLWKSWKLQCFSNGSSLVLYAFFKPSTTPVFFSSESSQLNLSATFPLSELLQRTCWTNQELYPY